MPKPSLLAAYPPAARKQLGALRKLILDTAKKTEGVGALEETLKWNQPSFLTSESRSGTTIRIGMTKSGGTAMYFHCQTNLVETFRKLYPKDFTFEGNRALHFDAEKKLPEAALRHCIALALTYRAPASANAYQLAPSTFFTGTFSSEPSGSMRALTPMRS